MTGRCGQSRTQRVELVMKPLLGLLPILHQPPAMPHRCSQLLDHHFLGLTSTSTLASQVGQCRAITVIGLESP